jgi:ankyrin repeat protein
VSRLLKDKRFDPSALNNIAIRWASENGHAELVKILLLDQRVDLSRGNNEPIRLASKNGHIEVVKLLLTDQRVKELIKDQSIIEEPVKVAKNNTIRFANENFHEMPSKRY